MKRQALTAAVALLASLATAACGGSSSETPWPKEPDNLEPGPVGENLERGNVVDTKKLPDNYTKDQDDDASDNDDKDDEE